MRVTATTINRRGSYPKALGVWIRQELVLLLREPVAIFFSLVFPIVIYLFIGVPYADEVIEGDVRFIDAMFPALVGTVGANLLLMGLPIYIAELRGKEVDKRYRSLPLPGWMFGIAVMVAMLSLVAAASGVIVAMIGLANGLRGEVVSPVFLILAVGFIAMLCPIGFFLGTLPFSARAIQAITAGVFFLLFFGSGAAAPLEGLPQAIRSVMEWNPLKIWFDAMIDVYVGSGLAGSSIWKILLTLGFSACTLVIGLRSWKRVS